jgi:hypothetical protein
VITKRKDLNTQHLVVLLACVESLENGKHTHDYITTQE